MPKNNSEIDKPLGRIEATMVADMLKQKGKNLPNGYIAVWRKKPSQVAKDYSLALSVVLDASRRQIEA